MEEPVDIAAWLRGLGLQQYEQAFRENDISRDVLSSLTAGDLRDLGVTSVGHRRKLLDAIAALGARTASSSEPVTRASAQVTAAERRQLTVMFCDLVGSTALSARFDPEDLREIIGAYHRHCADVIAQFGGFVAKYMGDGVLAYFGYPQAHEDDVERAVRAGLALVETVAKLDAGARTALQVRVGVATGLVVVGDLIGEGAAREQAVVGETPNLAARLQALAEPGTVVIGASTRRLLGELFEYRTLGSVSVKGFGDPVPVWQVSGLSAVDSRFEALRATTTPLVGRDEEIELLMRRWQQVRRGDGSVVLISGEPGIGKSRIAQTILARVSGEPHIRLRYFCSPHHQNSALYPTITQLERAVGFQREDTLDQRLDKLEAVLALATNDLGEVAPLLAELLSIPTGDRYPPLKLSPQQRKRKTLRAKVAQVEGLAARQPVLMVVEDVHWSDPTSLELWDLMVDQVPALRVLLIITFRPEFAPPWVGRPQVTLLSLNRLPARQRAEMITRVTGGKPLPKEIADQIIDRTDGVPLFIEELTKAVIESSMLTEAGDCYTMAGPLSPLAIPATLHASLLARLDRLAPVREVAQIAAALGRQFSHELISAVAPMPSRQMDAALAQLVSAELIFRRGTPPDAEYTFKHALVRDAAYGTLLKVRRQELHARIAQVYEDCFPEQMEMQPELIAYHCMNAGLAEKAIDYWEKAGQRAVRRSATAEAVAHFTKALDLLADLPEGVQLHRHELALQLALAGALLVAKGWASPLTGDAYARARELCGKVGEAPQLVATLAGLFAFRMNRAELRAARQVASELLRLGEQHDDPKLYGHRAMGSSFLFQAEFTDALVHLQRALDTYDPIKHCPPTVTPADNRVVCRSFVAWVLQFQGHLDEAAAQGRRALAEAYELAHPYTLAFALHASCLFRQVRGDGVTLGKRSAELVTLAADQGFPHLLATGTFFRGWAMPMVGGATDQAIAEMQRGLAAKRATGAELKVPYYLGLMAGVAGRADRDGAMSLLAEALARVDKTGECWFEAELHRLRGELLLAPSSGSEVADAEVSFQRALALAREQQARLWEVRAATSLAHLWRDQGRRTEARELLAPVYEWFTEGFDTPVLRDAKALLDQLG
jgi:class 3 adenylate cyclase/predicted ATPase